MKKLLTLTMGAAMFMLNSCTNDTLPEMQTPDTEDTTGVTFIANGFMRGDMNSRTAIEFSDGVQAGFAWTEGDTIGIAPSSGAQAYFVIGEGAGTDRATFSGGAWALKTDEASNYASYYPFIGDIYLKRTQIPVNYLGQTYQPAENNILTSLAPFDYMAAKASTAESTGNVNFQFKHLSSLVEVQFTLPKAGTVNSFSFTADEKVLPVKGTFNLTANPVTINSTEEDMAYAIPVAVNGLATTAEKQDVSVFFLMPPADLSEATLGFTVNYSYEVDGETVTENLPFTIEAGKNMTSGKWWQYTTDMITEGQPDEIVISDDVANFSGCIHEALGELGGTKLRFIPASTVTSDDVVYEDEYKVKAYAVRNGDWLEVHTLANSFKFSDSSLYKMFEGEYFANLTDLVLSGFDTSEVTDMISMFSGCSSLVSLDLSSFDTSNVTTMGGMFDGCSSLVSLDLSDFNTAHVIDMTFMFQDCSSLTELIWGDNFDTSSVIDMSCMFQGCSSLASLDLSHFDTSGVKYSEEYELGGYMSYMFSGCSSLTSLNLSSFNTSSVTDMSCMFSGCFALESITFGENFSTASVTNMSYMFQGCLSLTSLDLIKFETSKVTDMSYMFDSCSVLKSITFGENFSTASVKNMSYMFQSCSSLTSLDLSKFETSKVESMYCMFQSCWLLTSLDLIKFETSNVTDMSRMFYDCTALESIKFGEKFSTAAVTDMNNMFSGCSSLTSLNLSSFTTAAVTDMNNMFYGCYELDNLDLTNFTFVTEGCDYADMFNNLGWNSYGENNNTPVAKIYVTKEGYKALEGKELGLICATLEISSDGHSTGSVELEDWE